jgi:hypothetical protein
LYGILLPPRSTFAGDSLCGDNELGRFFLGIALGNDPLPDGRFFGIVNDLEVVTAASRFISESGEL